MGYILNFCDFLSVKFARILALCISIFVMCIPLSLNAQYCAGVYHLSNQTDIDNFNCIRVSGSVIIEEVISGNINNIESLSELVLVSEDLKILGNVALSNLDRLSSLVYVGGDLIITNNSALTNIDGLSGLTMVGGSIGIGWNNALTNVDGLSRITSHDWWLVIAHNSALTNVNGLSGLTLAGELEIYNNDSLTNVDGLSGLLTLISELEIDNNDSLTRCCGVYPLFTVGTVWPWSLRGNGIGCNSVNEILAAGPCEIEVDIDIKPGSYPNSINLKSKGKIPVAILTTDDFDANDVSPFTCLFANTNPLHWKMEDVDYDGDYDMLLHFKTQEFDLTNESTEATLECETIHEIKITGTDSVNIVPKGKGH